MAEPTPGDIAAIQARFLRATPEDTMELDEVIALNNTSNQRFADLAAWLAFSVPEGRELSHALTLLQTAKFFVNEARIQELRKQESDQT